VGNQISYFPEIGVFSVESKYVMKIISIVITHNGSKTICDCLNSLQNSNQNTQTIVIDNASTDDTKLLIQSFPDIVYFPLEKNIGFGQANNVGIDYAIENNADFIFLLNQDAMVIKDTIGKLVEIAVAKPEFGIISPIHLNGNGSEIDLNFSKYIIKENHSFLIDAYYNRLKPVYQLPFINAAAWLISSNCINTVGKFDPLFFMYGEDNDYCYRVLKSGFKIGLIPDAIIYHKRTINLPPKSNWDEMNQRANRNAVMIIVNLIKTRKNFLKAIIFWMIDHNSKILKILINRAWKELAISFLAGLKVLYKLPDIRKHIMQIQAKPSSNISLNI